MRQAAAELARAKALRALKQSSPTSPVASALLSGSEGELPETKARMETLYKVHSAKCAGFSFPCAAPSSSVGSRGFAEDCPKAARPLRGQVPQAPRVYRAAQDQSGIGVPFSLVAFYWASKRK